MPEPEPIALHCEYYQIDCPYHDNDRYCNTCIREDMSMKINEQRCQEILLEQRA